MDMLLVWRMDGPAAPHPPYNGARRVEDGEEENGGGSDDVPDLRLPW